MSYWDIHDFLAEEESMIVSFKVDADGMEFLAPYKGFTEGIPEDQPIQLPIWRATNLNVYCEQNNLLDLKVPKNYQSFFSYLHSFTKDSCPNNSKIDVVNLKRKSNYYYQVAATLSGIFEGNNNFASLAKIGRCFCERADWITNKAMSTNEMIELDQHKKKFTNSEFRIYKSALNQVISYSDWKHPKKRVTKKRRNM